MNLCWRKAQGTRELGDSLEQSTRDNVDSLAMSPQHGDGLCRSADHFVGIAPCEPSKSRSVGPHQVEAFGIDGFEWNRAVHRGFGQRGDLSLAAGAACQLSMPSMRMRVLSQSKHTASNFGP